MSEDRQPRFKRARTWIARTMLSGAKRFAAGLPGVIDDFWYERRGAVSTQAGQSVSADLATKISVVNACVRIYSNAIAMLPVSVNEMIDRTTKRRRPAVEHEVHRLLVERPNSYQTPFEFKQEIAATLAMRGNFYGEKIRSRTGELAEIWGIGEDDLFVDWFDRKSGRERVYDVSSAHDGRPRVLVNSNVDQAVWHPHLMSMNGGLTGESPIMLNAEGVGLALAGQTYAAKFFSQGARVAGFMTPEEVLTGPQRKQFSKAINEDLAGEKAFHTYKTFSRPMKFHQVSVTPRDSALIEMMSWSVADIARIWGIPLWLLQQEEKDTSWGTGLEQLGKGMDIYTLTPVIVAIEESGARYLLTDPQRYSIDFEMDALKRADLEARYKSYAESMNSNNPWTKRNEIRAWENLPPDDDPDADRILVPTNNVGNGDAQRGPGNNGARGSNGHIERVLYDEHGRKLDLERFA